MISSLQVIRHHRLNLAERPCQPSPDYDYARCVRKRINVMAGCQPPWRLFSVESIPICQNASMLHKYKRLLKNVTYSMDGDDIYQATNCLMPCIYMEYKVIVQFFSIEYFLKINFVVS